MPPFDYRYADVGILSVDEEEADVVRRIYEWYLGEGLGAPCITDRLASLQIHSPADRRTNTDATTADMEAEARALRLHLEAA